MLLVTLVLLIVLEIGIRIFDNQVKHAEVLDDQKSFVSVENGYIRLRPNKKIKITGPEFTVLYEHNSEGMRDKNTYLDKTRDTTKVRVLVLGDSFTYGEANDYDSCWHVKLEKELKIDNKPVEIVKAGISSYDQYLEYKYLKDIISIYNPDYVMIGFLPNDLFTNKPIDLDTSKSLDELSEGRENLASNDSKGFNFTYHTLLWAKSIVLKSDAFYTNAYEKTYRINYYKPATNFDESIKKQYHITEDLFKQLNKLCNDNNAKLVVVSIPQFYQVVKGGSDIDAANNIDEYFTTVAKRDGYSWISTVEPFAENYKKNKKDTHFRVDGHLTPLGNTILKDAIINSNSWTF